MTPISTDWRTGPSEVLALAGYSAHWLWPAHRGDPHIVVSGEVACEYLFSTW